MRTHPSPGFSTILVIAIALVILGAAIVGILAYGSGNQPAMPTVNASASTSDSVVKLMCAQDAECAAYCGLDSCYTPFCDGTKHCACNYTCEPVPAGNTDTSTTVTDFTSCAAAGNPVQESYPRKCSAGGVTFTEVLANANGSANSNQSTNANVSTADWKTYTSATYDYSFKYPKEYTATIRDNDIFIANANGKDVLDVRYRLEATDGSLATWFDNAPVGDATLGGRAGKKFIFRYCDGPGCGQETVAYVVQHEGKLLGFEFLGDKVMSDTENVILSTFTFTE